jgi:hypothetical protein
VFADRRENNIHNLLSKIKVITNGFVVAKLFSFFLDCGGKVCYNRGVLDPGTCTCSCNWGWTGDLCETSKFTFNIS